MPLRILLTGSAGRVGQGVCAELKARGHFVRGWDLRATPGVDDARIGGLDALEPLREACAGMDVLIHLAAVPDEDDFLTKLLPNNIAGSYRAFEAARLAGVKRIVFASTGQLGHHGPFPATGQTPPTPRNFYASGKLFAEGAGQMYAHRHGISFIALRLGWCPRSADDHAVIDRDPFSRDTYLSPGDAGRVFACAAEAGPQVNYLVCYATSRPVEKTYFSNEDARALLGYEPRDRWPEGV
ncbi:MAG: NAD(P)-dependent oxidoreductase [Planctomycetota bacterium]|nr:NAD(P)-dependent oxidoreductase [Planctomycetota bacterium]